MERVVKLVVLVFFVVVFGSTQHILLPLFAGNYPSVFFLLSLTSLLGSLLYTIILFFFGFRLPEFWEQKYFILIAIVDSFMCFCFIYATDPEKTPVLFQSIMLGLTIFPNTLFSYIILSKSVRYDYKYIAVSIFCLLVSISVASIGSLESISQMHIGILVYFLGVVLLSLSNVLQEAYVRDKLNSDDAVDDFEPGDVETRDLIFSNLGEKIQDLKNKVELATFTTLYQTLSVVLLYSILIFAGKGQLVESLEVLKQTDQYPLLIGFVVACALCFLASIYLNQISSNYNAILTNLTNQSVALFFVIFPSLNAGTKHSLIPTLFSIAFSVVSVIIWISKGEINLPPTDKKSQTIYGTL